jgi:hypothetical protein
MVGNGSWELLFYWLYLFYWFNWLKEKHAITIDWCPLLALPFQLARTNLTNTTNQTNQFFLHYPWNIQATG